MCGIAGFIYDKTPFIDGNEKAFIIKKMTDSIAHRGPDGEGFYDAGKFVFGHRRLSIIDLSDAGHQPMHYMGRYTITYNGEVYNYIELKEQLTNNGYSFSSQTDTEVIMAAYDYWGTECLSKFNGMWAFVIYDNVKQTFFISRDRFGVKPLYFYKNKEIFIFASEIKAILQHPKVETVPNLNYLSQYLEEGPKEYIEETAFKDIRRFPHASYIVVDHQKISEEIIPSVFWKLNINTSNEVFDQSKAESYAQQYFEILSDAVKIRLRADVKVGSALSGGLDSSSIVYLVNQHLKTLNKEYLQETFSSVYKTKGTEDCDESKYINLLAEKLGVNSNQIEPNVEDVPTEHAKVIWHMENPPESTLLSSWYTFKKTATTTVKVTLDGQGADEQLAGYMPYIVPYLTNLKLNSFLNEAKALLFISKEKRLITLSLLLKLSIMIFRKTIVKKMIKKTRGWDFCFNLNNRIYRDFSTSLITLLHYADHTSMAHSIESRMPFMDYRLVEFLASIPGCYKIHNGWTKYIARLAFDKKIPDEICWRKDKQGWPIPEKLWFSTNCKLYLENKVSKSKILVKLKRSSSSNEAINFKKNIRELNIALLEDIFFKKM